MKLRTKIILTFGFIILLTGIFQSIYLYQQVKNIFQIYLEENQSGMVERLARSLESYYEMNGSWEGAGIFAESSIYGEGQRGPGMMRGRMGLSGMASASDFVVLDQNGSAVADTGGIPSDPDTGEYEGVRRELTANGRFAGTLVVHDAASKNLLGIEQQFMDSTNRSILLGSIGAILLAVAAGYIFAGVLTKPLNRLMSAAERIGKGETDHKVTVESRDEFQDLAGSFNDMSEALARNEEARRALVADVAHELRTPLAILSGRLESIQEGAIEADEKTILQMSDEVYRLSRLVQDLQQLTLAEAGKLTLNLEPVEPGTLIRNVVEHFKWAADEKGISLHFDEGNEIPLLNLDADRITQVVVNLVGNALRHTPEDGDVSISLYHTNKEVTIEVLDTGPGIEEELLPHIFERFYRTDSARTRNDGGTGLGLSIAKGFVEAHGGTLTVSSKKGKGTSFFAVLPLAHEKTAG
ncbi:sensor histidine kinase [Bacillus marinisedimentorum]|uniref:sensor histidine kinase n=1 Tax=Bacillus marinisedimentorum TaxID=1821260 RepID=UPI000872A7FF|nr:ATP-binding protein [Bacillus marinisedimentorum]